MSFLSLTGRRRLLRLIQNVNEDIIQNDSLSIPPSSNKRCRCNFGENILPSQRLLSTSPPPGSVASPGLSPSDRPYAPINRQTSRFMRPIGIDLDQIEPNVSVLGDVAQHFFDHLFNPPFSFLTNVFQKHGFEIRIVGGAVRDLLQGFRPFDIDFVTDARIVDLVKIIESDEQSERIRFIQAGASENYGTVKVRVDDKQDFEINELRSHEDDPDNVCRWLLDSARRDFTFNAMYLKLDGTLIDFHGGENDLRAGDVVFVGDAQERIKEDPLRILRYFRFFGKVTRDPYHHRPGNLKLMAKYRKDIGKLHSRRIWMEMKIILKGDNIAPVINTMHECDILRFIGFPHCSEKDMDRFRATCARTSGSRPHPCTLLADFFPSERQVGDFANRLSLNRDERNLLLYLVGGRRKLAASRRAADFGGLKAYEHEIVNEQWPPGQAAKRKDQVLELFKYQGLNNYILGNSVWGSSLDSFRDWNPPTIPVTLYDLIKVGISGWGENWGGAFAKLTSEWQRSNYEMTKEELLEIAKNDLDSLEQSRSSVEQSRM